LKYLAYLKTLKTCPFCEEDPTRSLLENENAYLTYSLAPYHKYHLLVIPKRHVEKLKDLKWHEQVSITALLYVGIKALDALGHDDCSIVAKDNFKTIPHLHYHIIPGGEIEDISLDTEMRSLLTKTETINLTKELEKQLSIFKK